MTATWRDRRTEIDALLPEIEQVVQRYLDSLDESTVRKSVLSRDPGYLLDFAAHARISNSKRGRLMQTYGQAQGQNEARLFMDIFAAHHVFHRLAELELSAARDFQIIQTLTEHAQTGSFVSFFTKAPLFQQSLRYTCDDQVNVVTQRDLGNTGRVYVSKSISKARALILEGVCRRYCASRKELTSI